MNWELGSERVADEPEAVPVGARFNWPLERQCYGGINPQFLHALAAAYAETGDFPSVLRTAGEALRLAKAQSNTALVAMLLGEIRLYETTWPYRSSPYHRPFWFLKNIIDDN